VVVVVVEGAMVVEVVGVEVVVEGAMVVDVVTVEEVVAVVGCTARTSETERTKAATTMTGIHRRKRRGEQTVPRCTVGTVQVLERRSRITTTADDSRSVRRSDRTTDGRATPEGGKR
jgi:hypothetical protein